MSQASTEKAQEYFQQGSEYLAQKKFAEAASIFEQLHEQGFLSSGLEHNLALSLAETGKTGEAIAHFHNAIALDRWNQQYRQDLQIAQERVASSQGTTLAHPVEWSHSIASYIRAGEFFSIFSISLLITLGLWAFEKLNKKKLLACLSANVALLVIALFATLSSSVATIKTETNLLSAPILSATPNMKLVAGTRVRIIRSSGSLSEVERPGGFRGWVESQHLAPSNF